MSLGEESIEVGRKGDRVGLEVAMLGPLDGIRKRRRRSGNEIITGKTAVRRCHVCRDPSSTVHNAKERRFWRDSKQSHEYNCIDTRKLAQWRKRYCQELRLYRMEETAARYDDCQG